MQAERKYKVLTNTEKMFESRFSATATEKIPGREKPHAKTVACFCDMEGQFQKCVERCCELTNKKTEQLLWERIGRPDIVWSVIARAATKWTRACDKCLARLFTQISVDNIAMRVNTACRLGLFQDLDFVGDLEESKSTLGEISCIFGSRTFVHMSSMCKKQTSVSHSSTESTIISLNAGVHMDGMLALDLWDVVIKVLHS